MDPNGVWSPGAIGGLHGWRFPTYHGAGGEALSSTTRLAIEVVLDEDADAQEADEATGRLRRELLALDVDAVERVSAGEPPDGARAIDMAAVGALAVSMARSPMLLAQLVRAIQGWVAGRASRSVKIELDGDTLEVTGVSSADQQRLIDSWLARHSTGS